MIAAQLAELIGTEQVSADAEILAAHRFDRWCLKHWHDWQGVALDAPACVVRPRDSKDVQSVVRCAAEHNIPIVPWGLGSGVCGGVEPRPDQILIDMSAMDQVLSIDEENLLLPLNLFAEVKRCLKKGGVFQLVTSNHLNLKTHLFKLFHKVKLVAQNDKFVVYHCQ